MRRVRAARKRGVGQRYSEAMNLLSEAGDYAFVIRGVPRSVVMKCPDGCGEIITVNLDRRSGPAWRFYDKENRLTLYPSVWRQTGCKAHFIVWRDQILWCDRGDGATWNDDRLVSAVSGALSAAEGEFRHYESIAADLDAIPWDVLWACQHLEHIGAAVSRQKKTEFRSAPEARRARRHKLDIFS